MLIPRRPRSISSTQAAGAELDDVVALRLARLVDEVDDEHVAVLGRAALDWDELGDRRAQRLELAVDELLGHLGLRRRHLEAAQSATSGGGCTATSAVKLKGSSSEVGTS